VLHAGGATRVFEDCGVSGARTERPGLNAARSFLREGDTLVVWTLDRFGRSMTHVLRTVADLGIEFRFLTENVDTTPSTGRLMFHIFGALSQFERDLIPESTNADLTAAATHGRKGGRPAAATSEKAARARQLIASGLNLREGAAHGEVGKSALYAAFKTGLTAGIPDWQPLHKAAVCATIYIPHQDLGSGST
jgi:DNA invertase Pin-like site-specific DNA recombinase